MGKTHQSRSLSTKINLLTISIKHMYYKRAVLLFLRVFFLRKSIFKFIKDISFNLFIIALFMSNLQFFASIIMCSRRQKSRPTLASKSSRRMMLRMISSNWWPWRPLLTAFIDKRCLLHILIPAFHRYLYYSLKSQHNQENSWWYGNPQTVIQLHLQ